MKTQRISDEEMNAVGVTGLPDVPGLSTRAMQEKFDEPAKKLIAPRLNALLEELDALGISSRVLNGGGVVYLRLNEDKVLETSADGKTWEATSSSGHVVLGNSGNELPQRSRIRFENCDVEDENGVTVVTARPDKYTITPNDIGAYTKKQVDNIIASYDADNDGIMDRAAHADNADHADSADNADHANNSDHANSADNADNSAHADRATFDLPLYAATLAVDGWTASGGGYTQTVACTPADGGPALTAAAQLGGAMTRPTGVQATDEALLDALSIINAGTITPGAAAVTVAVWEQPECDIPVYWYGR